MTPAEAGRLTLVEMDEAAFREYRMRLVPDYAREKIRAGAWSPSEAEGRAARDVDSLVPDGPNTSGHFISLVRDESEPADVGVLWFATEESGTGLRVWVYDIVIHEWFRRRGYGALTLKLLEERAVALGVTRIDLHVFRHNHGARRLYEASGYEVTDLTMSRTLPGHDG